MSATWLRSLVSTGAPGTSGREDRPNPQHSETGSGLQEVHRLSLQLRTKHVKYSARDQQAPALAY